MAAEHVTDHVARALARLRQQFKDKPNIEAWITALVTPVQRLEDALWQLLTERGIDDAIGAQLDRIGKIVGQPRNGRGDDVYRRFIRARIATNKSNGTIEDVLTVARLVLDDDDVTLTLARAGTAQLLLKLEDAAVDLDLAELLTTYFLRRVVAAGCRIVVEASPTPSPSVWFSWGDNWDDGALLWSGAYD